MTIVLKIEDVRKSFAISYAGKKSTFGTDYKDVIKDLSMRLKQGEVTALVGGNGAGKTSLFNLISGLLKPDSGTILFTGSKETIDCTQVSPWKIARAGIGRGFQGARIFTDLSVMDHLILQAMPPKYENPINSLFKGSFNRKQINDIEARINEELSPIQEFNEILKFLRKPASSLSYARQRLLSMAGLLIGSYEFLLLDEPTSGLSPDSIHGVQQMIERIREQGKSVFLIEHNMEFVRSLSDVCHYMSAGEIELSGTPEEVLNNQNVQQSYLL